LMDTGWMSTDSIPAGTKHAGTLHAGPPETAPGDSAGSPTGSGATGFLELILADGDLLDAEFQELISRILPPSRSGAPVLAPAAGWERGRFPLRGGNTAPPLGTSSSRMPPPARERSPPQQKDPGNSTAQHSPDGRACAHTGARALPPAQLPERSCLTLFQLWRPLNK